MRILIAEDDAVAARILQLTLESFGHEVRSSSDGVAAWEAFDREPVRVIVSDWLMPGMDGLELCKKVRERSGTSYTYFILLTAKETKPENFDLAADAGVDDFLAKPLDRQAIRMRLRVAERILLFTTEIRRLGQIIPICSWCRKIRTDDNYWQLVETYIAAQSGGRISHAMCPACLAKENL